MDNLVTLVADGIEYGGWKSVEISAGIEQQSRDFSLGVTWRWPGSGKSVKRIDPGAKCEVFIGPDLVLTGYVYASPIFYDGTQINVGASGRSLTSDLVDCSAARGQWRGQTIAGIVQALAKPYGISVVDQAKDSNKLFEHQTQPNETVFDSIDRLLEMSALLSTDNEKGQVVIAKIGSNGSATDSLELGTNILSASVDLDFSEVFSEYECVGQRSGTDDAFGIDAAEVQGLAKDGRTKRYRNLTVEPSGQLSPSMAVKRAEWERESRISKALKAEYTVQGWRQSDGRLWVPNMYVRVRDTYVGFDRDMLIGSVQYQLNDQGMKTRLTVAPPGAYDPKPKVPKKGKKSSSSDSFEYLLPEDWDKK